MSAGDAVVNSMQDTTTSIAVVSIKDNGFLLGQTQRAKACGIVAQKRVGLSQDASSASTN